MVKVRNIALYGFRGVRKSLEMNLESSKSLLLYGDNGSGKSSISDAFEWFYRDKVDHLSKEEIGTKGTDALRNIFLPDDKDALVEFKFTEPKYDAGKKLFYKKAKLTSAYSPSSDDLNSYLAQSLSENLFLRYKDLLRFILATKADKLKELSQIIGFAEVTKVKTILKKATSDLNRDFKQKNYEQQISQKQALILEQLEQHITNDEQYFNAIKELVAPLGVTVEVNDEKNIDEILELIRKPEDKDPILDQASYEKAVEALNNLRGLIKSILAAYETFFGKYQAIINDIKKLNKISLENLLSEGLSVLEKRLFDDDRCPLCLQNKERESLIDELRKRIEELTLIKKEKDELEEAQKFTLNVFQSAVTEINTALRERAFSKEAHTETKKNIEHIKKTLSTSLENLNKYTLNNQIEIPKPSDFIVYDEAILQKAISVFTEEKTKISKQKKDDKKFSANSKITLARQAYKEIKALKVEVEKYQNQILSMELICNNFIKRQKEALTVFLRAISKDINELYLYMNDAEKVDEIELITLGDDDDFEGITIQFKFHGAVVSPPDKYLSESHLNCLGICLFLSSVRAFNKVNKFFILDDVISSFDRNHRGRFAHLLKEKFSDYQILLFTHEKDWFEYVANMVKGLNWLVKRTIWNHEEGASIEIPLYDLKQRIDAKIDKSDTSELGNMIRQYLERLLKEVCYSLEVKVKFLYNDRNETRMVNELLSEMKAKLKERKCDITNHLVFDRLASSVYLGNVTSHDSLYSESIADLMMLYKDVVELESLFRCNNDNCHKLIAKKHYDDVNKKIRCSCGHLTYDWKK